MLLITGVQDVRVSAVIPSWNGAAVLGPCLDSIARQVVAGGLETIVVDDGSTDATPEVLRGHAGVCLLSNDRSVGYSAATNQGAAAARGRVLVLLNSDTELVGSDTIERLATAAETPNIGLVGPMLLNVDGTLQPSCGAHLRVSGALVLMSGLHRLLPDRVRARVTPHTWSHDRSRDVDWVKGAAMAIRADLFRELGGLWPALFGEETDLAFRVRKQGLRIRFERTARVVHRGGYSLDQKLSEAERAVRVADSQKLLLVTHYGRLRRVTIRGILLAGYGARAVIHSLLGRRSRAVVFREMARVMASN